jgi:hypothetical protein
VRPHLPSGAAILAGVFERRRRRRREFKSKDLKR